MGIERIADYLKRKLASFQNIFYSDHQDEDLFTVERIYNDTLTNQKMIAFRIKGKRSLVKKSILEVYHDRCLIGGMPRLIAAHIGYFAKDEELKNFKKYIGKDKHFSQTTENQQQALYNRSSQIKQALKFYGTLCLIYTTLIIAGNSIVARLFPFHFPLTHLTVPFGAGILLFPMTFMIQDITTEVYGYARGRRMVWLSLFMLLFYLAYTQIAVHLPTEKISLYAKNESFLIAFDTMPRHVIALIVSFSTGSLINDFIMSKTKILLHGRFLWGRSIGATMIGELVVQIVGGIIGFSGTLSFIHQLLPNMCFAYLYKLFWNVTAIPFIYLICNALKRVEGIDVYDYETNYNPFSLKV